MAATRTTTATVALLVACLLRPSAVRLAAAVPADNDYMTELKLVTTIVEQDEFWSQVFDQSVYHRLDRTWYGRIVDEELLEGARDETANRAEPGDAETETNARAPAGLSVAEEQPGPSAPGPSASASAQPVVVAAAVVDEKADAIRPMQFVRNVMRKRYRIGSVLQMAVDVLQKSLTCLAYKYSVHLLKLIRVEISRNSSTQKGLSWSGKAIGAVAVIVMKMAGLHFTDARLLEAAALLDSYSHSKNVDGGNKFDLLPGLDLMSRKMLEYIGVNCVRAPKDESAVAKELRVLYTPNLFSTTKSKTIKSTAYKGMVTNIMERIAKMFNALPGTVGMTAERWDEILHFKREADKKETFEFYRISRR